MIPIETLILGKQNEYYEALSISGKTGTSTPFIEFMLETIEEALLSRQNDTINDTINDTERTILRLIQQNPTITIDELITNTGKSRRTITRALSSLKKQKIIARTGSNKTGHWEITYEKKNEDF